MSTEHWLTIEQAAARMHVDERTIWNWRARGQVASMIIGRRILIAAASLPDVSCLMPVTKAAKTLGMSRAVVYRRIRSGALRTVTAPSGRRLVVVMTAPTAASRKSVSFE
jgi:predicted DNA-binding protein (UPF0251 family)